MADRYVEALKQIPEGETRSFGELAAMAGRPGAARAAGRAVRGCVGTADVPWHRVVAADGKLVQPPAADHGQLERLRAEGARPRENESAAAWGRRRGFALVGKLPDRVFVAVDDPRVGRALRLEPLLDEPSALARGFRPIDDVSAPPRIGEVRRRRPASPRPAGTEPLPRRLRDVGWDRARAELASQGYFALRALLTPDECEAILSESERPARFDRGVEMLENGYGVGVYRYWTEPLPAPLSELRAKLYEELEGPAGELRGESLPATLDGFWRACRARGQRRPSSILIQYPTRGVNHPHRDIYGKLFFPFQALVVLSRLGRDFEGGEFVLIEERVDGDVRREVQVDEGDVVVFCAESRREQRGARSGKVPLLHAMNPVTRGEREAVGLVFHLAE